jgi:murein DD-endopeptidase MepM/ murein hydrolase activator NlpD
MGRCTAKHYTNDKFAVDYLLDRGDYVYSPLNCGKVTFAGRKKSYKIYGIFNAVRACNGNYASLSAHLKGLNSRLDKGDQVDRLTVLGYAGNTSYGDFAAGPVHLHQAFYRYPTYTPDGAPYGGRGYK